MRVHVRERGRMWCVYTSVLCLHKKNRAKLFSSTYLLHYLLKRLANTIIDSPGHGYATFPLDSARPVGGNRAVKKCLEKVAFRLGHLVQL